jgi:hypothetical protein
VQTYKTNYDKLLASCAAGVTHKDLCESATEKNPLYRPIRSPPDQNQMFEEDGGNADFPAWQMRFADLSPSPYVVIEDWLR